MMTSDDLTAGLDAGSAMVLDNEPPAFPSLEPQAMPDAAAEEELADEVPSLELVLDIPIQVTVELGRAEIPIRDIVNVSRGSIVDLDGVPGAPLDVRVNGVLIGRGEIVVIDEERLGLRLVEVVSPAERVRRLR
jgi:flagellar motor switch protein FliN